MSSTKLLPHNFNNQVHVYINMLRTDNSKQNKDQFINQRRYFKNSGVNFKGNLCIQRSLKQYWWNVSTPNTQGTIMNAILEYKSY